MGRDDYMEPIFQVEYTPDKALLNSFGRLTAKRNKATIVILVCSLLLLVFFPFLLWFDSSVAVYSGTMGSLFLLFWLFYDRYAGSLNRKMQKGTEQSATYSFGDTDFVTHNALGETRLLYAALTELEETDEFFALYLNKHQAILVPKRSFTLGNAEAFGNFLTEKTGKRMKQRGSCRPRSAALIAGVITGLVLYIVACAADTILLRNRPAKEETLTVENYSITVTENYETFDDADFLLCASYDDNVYLYVYNETDAELTQYGLECADAKAYAEMLVELYDVDATFKELENGAVCVLYEVSYEDSTIYYCDAVVDGGDAFWISEFYCLSDTKSIYAPLMERYASTIRVGE